MQDRPKRIYLDNAATSWPKPDSVYTAVDHYQRELGAAYARGGYDTAVRVQAVVDRCRSRAARLLGVSEPKRVIFTFNATDSLNLAIRGVLRSGDHVIVSVLEHNSVSRPLRHLERDGAVEVTRIAPSDGERITVDDVRPAIQSNTRLIALIHASNVTGTIQAIEPIGQLAREEGILFLVDAAQTAGAIPIAFDSLPVDLLACAGHKGLLGPLGTGLLCLADGVAEGLESLRMGGTGTQSELDLQPDTLPDRYESGNHNVPGLFGLDAALGELLERGVDSVRAHERQLTEQLLNGIATIRGVTLVGRNDLEHRLGVVSITSGAFDPHTLSSLLAHEFGIETRAGLHCAPGIHRWLGTLQTGGTTRFSVGPFSTSNDVETAIKALTTLHTG